MKQKITSTEFASSVCYDTTKSQTRAPQTRSPVRCAVAERPNP